MSYRVADCKTFEEEILEVALPHSHMVVGSGVHKELAEVAPLTVPGVLRSPSELL